MDASNEFEVEEEVDYDLDDDFLDQGPWFFSCFETSLSMHASSFSCPTLHIMAHAEICLPQISSELLWVLYANSSFYHSAPTPPIHHKGPDPRHIYVFLAVVTQLWIVRLLHTGSM